MNLGTCSSPDYDTVQKYNHYRGPSLFKEGGRRFREMRVILLAAPGFLSPPSPLDAQDFFQPYHQTCPPPLQHINSQRSPPPIYLEITMVLSLVRNQNTLIPNSMELVHK